MTEQPTVFIPLSEIPKEFDTASDAYSVAFEIARAGDVLGWRQLIKRIKPGIFKSLVQWRQNELDGEQLERQEPFQVVDKAVDIISPLISVALMGVESGREEFRDQKSILDDLLHISGWSDVGHTFWVRIPYALGYVYHSLHGSISLSTNQLDLALSLARVKTPVAKGTKYLHVRERSELRGYSEAISGSHGGNCLKSWEYLTEAYKKWDWLSRIFGDDSEYRTSLVAYYMALNIHELATVIASGQQNTLNTSSEYYFEIPLTFLSEDQDIIQCATSLLRRNPKLMELWTCLNVTREQIEHSWEDWIRLSENQLFKYDRYDPPFNPVAHLNLSDIFHHLFEGF